jgi:hypothetical protein
MCNYDERESQYRTGHFHVRALSSGKVHPLALHSGAFEIGMGTSHVLAESPVVCCDHLAAVVHEHAWSHTTLTIKGTVIVWNWRTGGKVAVFVSDPLLGCFCHKQYSFILSF